MARPYWCGMDDTIILVVIGTGIDNTVCGVVVFSV